MIKKIYNALKQDYYILFIFLFAISVIRFLYFGFHYYPQLDDYPQYYNNVNNGIPFFDFLKISKMYAPRPFAFFFDYFFWSKFWNNMFVSVVIINALFSVSAFLSYKIFKKYFNSTFFLPVLMVLLPSNIEGTYWISASSRAVVSLFLAVLSIYLFDKFIDTDKLRFLFLSFFPSIIAAGIYEQAIILNSAGIALLVLFNIKKLKYKSFYGLFVFLSMGFYLSYTKIFNPGIMTNGRMKLSILQNFDYTLAQLNSVMFKAPYFIIKNGFIRSFDIIRSSPSFLYLFIILLLSIIIVLLMKRETIKINGSIRGLIFGLILSFAPLAVFFLVRPWMSLRAVVMCLPGITLFADSLLRLLFSKLKIVMVIISTVTTFVFLIVSVSEINDYRTSALNDSAVLKTVIRGFNDYNFNYTDNVVIVNLKYPDKFEQNYKYHEHIVTATSINWAFTNAYQAVSGDINPPMLIPAMHNCVIYDKKALFADYYFAYQNDTLVLLDSRIYNNKIELFLDSELYGVIYIYKYPLYKNEVVND